MSSGVHAATSGRRVRGTRGGARRAVPPGRIARQRRARRLIAAAIVVGSVLILLNAELVRSGEAWLQGRLLRGLGVGTHTFGTVVVADIDGRLAGISLTTGCSIGPLLALFLLACVPFVWFRAMSVSRVLLATSQLAAVLVLVNEIRIAAIVLSMREWGFQRGYDVSHVFLGSAISTLGFVIGAVLFARMFLSRSAGAGVQAA